MVVGMSHGAGELERIAAPQLALAKCTGSEFAAEGFFRRHRIAVTPLF